MPCLRVDSQKGVGNAICSPYNTGVVKCHVVVYTIAFCIIVEFGTDDFGNYVGDMFQLFGFLALMLLFVHLLLLQPQIVFHLDETQFLSLESVSNALQQATYLSRNDLPPSNLPLLTHVAVMES